MKPLVSCCISGCGTLPEDYNLDETPSYEVGVQQSRGLLANQDDDPSTALASPNLRSNLHHFNLAQDGCYPCWPDDLVAGSGDKAGQSEAEMRLSAADVMRSEGNVAYREGDDTRALFKYTQSIR